MIEFTTTQKIQAQTIEKSIKGGLQDLCKLRLISGTKKLWEAHIDCNQLLTDVESPEEKELKSQPVLSRLVSILY